MGEAGKNQAEKKDDGGAVVLKMDLHCEGCMKKVRRFVKGIDGVKEVKADPARNKLMVIGKVDPVKIRGQVAEKTKKKVDLISPRPKKSGGSGDEKKPAAEDQKADRARNKPVAGKVVPVKIRDQDSAAEDKKLKKPPAFTVVYELKLLCDGEYKGVQEVKVDSQKGLVSLKGTMDVKAGSPYLTGKLKVVPAKDNVGNKKAK